MHCSGKGADAFDDAARAAGATVCAILSVMQLNQRSMSDAPPADRREHDIETVWFGGVPLAPAGFPRVPARLS